MYMAARSEEKAKEAIRMIEAELQKDASGSSVGSVYWLPLNLSDPRLAKGAGTEFIQKEDRLDILGESPSSWE